MNESNIEDVADKSADSDVLESMSHSGLMKMAIIVECGMAILAVVLSYFGFFDHNQILTNMDWPVWKAGLLFGLIGTVPLVVYLAVFHFWNPWFFAPMRKVVDDHLKPLFSRCSIFDMILISLMAGFGEELLFRWCLQGGIAHLVGGTVGIWVGLAIASLIFGLCHWVNWSYGTITIFVGAYLGLLMIWTGWFLAPAVSHALFDFVALMYITKWNKKSELPEMTLASSDT